MYDHQGDTLKELHRLPIRYRIKFKVLLLVLYKCLNGLGPDYLMPLFKYDYVAHTIQLIEPRIFSQCGERFFHRVGPKMWNELRLDLHTCSSLDSFKVALKTHLHKQAFDIIENRFSYILSSVIWYYWAVDNFQLNLNLILYLLCLILWGLLFRLSV
jgi:hypothetical protein